MWLSPQVSFQGFLACPSPILINGLSSLDSCFSPAYKDPASSVRDLYTEGLPVPLNCHPATPCKRHLRSLWSHTSAQVLIWATLPPSSPSIKGAWILCDHPQPHPKKNPSQIRSVSPFCLCHWVALFALPLLPLPKTHNLGPRLRRTCAEKPVTATQQVPTPQPRPPRRPHPSQPVTAAPASAWPGRPSR